jgi:adenine deaminase
MSTESCQVVGALYKQLDQAAKQLGCGLRAPFMALSFLPLLVIPSLKLSDRGLFDVDRFEFVPLFV